MAKILIVEDSPTQSLALSLLLKKAGHATMVAEDGDVGLEMASRERPDLVLMDIVMPNLNGFQATRRMTTDPLTKDIPVVMLTSKNAETDKFWGMRQGARAYLTKPFKDNELVDTIHGILQGSPV